MDRGTSPNVVKTALDLVFDAGYGYLNTPGIATAENGNVFMQSNVDRGAVITEQFQGSGYFDSRDEKGDVSSGNSRTGNQKTFTVLNWAKSEDVPKHFFDDEQHQVVSKIIRAMGRNAAMTRDKNAFSIIANGFSTTTTNDGIALFHDSHVTLAGDIVDNKELGILNDTSLDLAFVSMIGQKTQDGTLGGHVPAVLLVPTKLFKTATTIAQTKRGAAGTANNDQNYYSEIYPGLQVLHSPFLGSAYGGSDTAWYLLSKDHSIMRWVRKALERDLVDYKFQRNNSYIYKAEYREVVGAISYEGCVGSTGTA